ncbi:hypothetical protein EV1_007630 [Malus domestica]
MLVDFTYIQGVYPPARCTPPFGNCSSGNSDVELLIAMHNILIAHAMAVDNIGGFFSQNNMGLSELLHIVTGMNLFETMKGTCMLLIES